MPSELDSSGRTTAGLALPATLRTLAARGEPRRYRKGTLLISEGDRGDTLFIILSGRVKAFSIDARDREIIYAVHGPGEFFGEMSLDGGPRSASVVTLEPTECVVLTRQTLREHIAANPEFAFELLDGVIRRARQATQSTRAMALSGVYPRMVGLLEALSEPHADGTRHVRDRLTHRDIASRLGCSREMISRLLKDLEQGGYLVVEQNRVVIKRPLPQEW